MNNKLITTYGQQIHSYKLKTKRQKVKAIKKGFNKKMIALEKEQSRLAGIKNNLPLVLLKEPYQKGWKRSFVLREDVARSGNAEFFKNILLKINNTTYSNRKDFKKRKRKNRKKVYVLQPQHLTHLLPSEFNKLNFTSKEASYFIKTLLHNAFLNRSEERFVFTEPWRYVLKTSANIITHSKMVDTDLESAIGALDYYIDKHFLEVKIAKAKCRHFKYKYYHFENPKYVFAKKHVNDWLFEISLQ